MGNAEYMGVIKQTKRNKTMKIAIIALLVAVVASQAVQQPMKKWMCCAEANNMIAPRWDTKCSGRRLQQQVPTYCTKKLTVPKRILQQAVHPVAANCSNFNARRRLVGGDHDGRRLQQPVKKCPVNIEGYQCFKNNTNKPCK